jgi:biotin carboxyl carrier protein
VTRRSPRVRVTIEAVPLVVQPDETEVSRFDPPRRGEFVTSLPPTATERADAIRRFEVVVDGWLFEAAVEPAGRAQLRERVARQAAEHHTAARVALRAQVPGRVVRVWVAEGEMVERGQRLLAIEAMKMENEIRAPQAGVVEAIAVQIGQRVERGEELLSLG